MLKSMDERTPPCGTQDLNWPFVDECCVCHASFDVVCDVSEYGMWYFSLSINVGMFTVSNALFMSNATPIVRVGGLGWLKPVATVLMLCSAVLVECLVLNPCCVVMFGMFCVIYGRITFSNVFAITDSRDIDLYDAPMLMSLLSVCAALYMFVRYFSPSLPMCLRCFMLMLSGPVELLFLLLLISCCLDLISCDVYMSCILYFPCFFQFVVLVL